MEYLLWVVVAMLAYAVTAPLASDITSEVPAPVALFLATAVFLLIAGGVLLLGGGGDAPALASPATGYVVVAGVFLTVGILAYVSALEAGPVSVVVPIYGSFIVGSSVVGILLLDEALTPVRAAGIGCAVLAIVLTAGEG